MNISDITEQEFIDNFDFLLELVERNGTTFRITRPDGNKVMLVPIKQSASPVDPEVMEQVESFRNEWLARLAQEQDVTQETRDTEEDGQEQ